MSKRQYQPATSEWFSEFVQGSISPTDIVLSPIERRLLPRCTPQYHATAECPLWFNGSRVAMTAPAPTLGEHTAAVLRELA